MPSASVHTRSTVQRRWNQRPLTIRLGGAIASCSKRSARSRRNSTTPRTLSGRWISLLSVKNWSKSRRWLALGLTRLRCLVADLVEQAQQLADAEALIADLQARQLRSPNQRAMIDALQLKRFERLLALVSATSIPPLLAEIALLRIDNTELRSQLAGAHIMTRDEATERVMAAEGRIAQLVAQASDAEEGEQRALSRATAAEGEARTLRHAVIDASEDLANLPEHVYAESILSSALAVPSILGAVVGGDET